MAYLILGLFVGMLGTLVGVGGGIFLVPIFLHFHPDLTAAQITSASLFCVAMNAFSGSIQYAYRNLIHFKFAILLIITSLPGIWFGIYLNKQMGREGFELYYAFLLLCLAIFLFLKSKNGRVFAVDKTTRISGKNYFIGSGVSLLVGAIASFFGVGGGIIYVPYLNQVLKFPVHLATGTSQFILFATVSLAVIQHLFQGGLDVTANFVFNTAIGMVAGAQLGAFYSKKIKGEVIVRILAIVVLVVALRTLYIVLV